MGAAQDEHDENQPRAEDLRAGVLLDGLLGPGNGNVVRLGVYVVD